MSRLPGVNAPLGVPNVIHGVLLGASWKWGAFQVVMMVLSYVVYLPFFSVLDKAAYESEQAAKASS